MSRSRNLQKRKGHFEESPNNYVARNAGPIFYHHAWVMLQMNPAQLTTRAQMPGTFGIGGAVIRWHAYPSMEGVQTSDGPDSGPLTRPVALVAIKQRSAAARIPA